MKAIGTVLTTFLAALAVAAANLGPLNEIRNAWHWRGRAVQSLFIGLTAAILLMSGALVMIIDAAVQYDQAAQLRWNAVFSCGAGLVVTGFFVLVLARWLWPIPAAKMSSNEALELQVLSALQAIVAHLQEREIADQEPAQAAASGQ